MRFAASGLLRREQGASPALPARTGRAALYRCFCLLLQGIDFRNVHKGEEFEEAIDISIRGVDPELVKFVRTGFSSDPATRRRLRFYRIVSCRFGDQRYGQAKHLVLMQTTGQIDAGGDVAPLVRAANLQRHAVQLVQAGKVVTLQQIAGLR